MAKGLSKEEGQQDAAPAYAPTPITGGLVERVAISVCAVTLFVVMLIGAADIISGEVFGVFLSFKVDMSGTLAAAAIFLAWPLVQRQRSHIRVDLFLSFMPRSLLVLGWWLTQLIGILVFGLIAYGAVEMARDSVGFWEKSAATLGYPIWPAKVACAVGAMITLAVFIHQALSGPKNDLDL
jgi:TRAP-type C4-dicarboxylate transport system permease small subunit